MAYNKRRILVIAGSDSSGGAGLEADQKVIAAHECYAMTATTALTAQNTLGVTDIHHVPPEFVAKQIDAVASDVGVDVVKTGMLASAETIKVVARALKRHSITKSVVDPVMVATSGAALLPPEAIKTLITDLLPQTYLLTPNIPEALLLLKEAGLSPGPITGVGDLERLARQLCSLGPENVLLKGGHHPLASPEDPSTLLIYNILHTTTTTTHPPTTTSIPTPHLPSRNTHGTGCSLASALASNLAHSHPLPHATRLSLSYISHSIASSLPLGRGSGPINHLSLVRRLPFPPGGFLPYLTTHPLIAPLWSRYVRHPFARHLVARTLTRAAYRRYLVQDHLYLTLFARARALAAFKAGSLAEVALAAGSVLDVRREAGLHVAECARLGVGPAELERAREESETSAYGRWLLDVGLRGDAWALSVATASCLVGYGVVAQWAKGVMGLVVVEGEGKEGGGGEGGEGVDGLEGYCERWVRTYAGREYGEVVKKGTEVLEREAEGLGPRQVSEAVELFAEATRLEIKFWDMCMRATTTSSCSSSGDDEEGDAPGSKEKE